MKAKILLLEDDMALQEIIAECLSEEGYEVVCCNDGIEASNKAYEENFDICFNNEFISAVSFN